MPMLGPAAMANRYYIPGEGRAAGVRDLFAAIAPRYDLINDAQSFGLHRLWKRRLVRWAGVRSGERALDLCCGTGDLALALAKAGAEVTGVDFSEPMLSVARRRNTAPTGSGTLEGRAGRPVFEQGDALDLRFPDGTFDLVAIGYGLRNLRSFEGGLAEMARVTRPGGRLLVLDFGKPRNRLWRALYFTHLRTLVPLLGRWCCGDADTHAYILKSLLAYPDARGIAGLMQAAGWRDVEWRELLGGVMTLHRGVK